MGRRSHHRHASGDLAESFDSAVDQLWATIASGDVLQAELQAAVFASMALMTDGSEEAGPEEFAGAVLDAAIQDQFTPESAAFCRLIVSLGTPVLKREASRRLQEHTDEGVYPPDWVTGAGRPAPRRAWRSYDVFGDLEYIVVTFGYGEAEHAILVGIDMTVTRPAVIFLTVSDDTDKLIEIVRDRPFERFEEITLAAARRRVEQPLASADVDLDLDSNESSFMTLPVARSRVRRLPADTDFTAVEYTAADRAAAVADFLHGPQAGSAGPIEEARFWAEVLTGYSGRVPGEPPGQVGPDKLGEMLLSHVVSTFTLTDSQRESLVPAVTAWVRWAAGRQGLDEAATARVLEHLPKVLENFGSAYDDPDSAVARGYVRDLAASDADVAWLADCRARRKLAVPPAGEQALGGDPLDPGDQEHRTVIALAEFGMCDTGGVPREDFRRAVQRVVEELWRDDPPATWQRARKLLATGMAPHDVIHALAR
jgi:hypothetical protein